MTFYIRDSINDEDAENPADVVDEVPAAELVEVAAEDAAEELALATTAEYCCISMTAASSNT